MSATFHSPAIRRMPRADWSISVRCPHSSDSQQHSGRIYDAAEVRVARCDWKYQYAANPLHAPYYQEMSNDLGQGQDSETTLMATGRAKLHDTAFHFCL